MSNEIIAAEAVDKNFEVAIALHERIMMSGTMAASALVEMCRGLKQMRDERLYTPLGHDNFEAYCEDRAGIKARQAYNYIAIIERLGADKLTEYADVGVTKLELISRLPFGERDEILEKTSEDGMSASEIKKLLEENKKQGEQISMLEEQLAEKLEVATSEKVEEAKKAVYTELEGKYKAELDELRGAVDRSVTLNKDLEAKVRNSDSSYVSVKIYFNSIKDSFNSACGLVKGMAAEDREKYKAALVKLLDLMKGTVEGI